MKIRPTAHSLVLLGAICGGAFVILFLATESTHAKKAACGPVRAQTVVADRTARVYRVVVGNSYGRTLYDYYGCAASHGKPHLLATTRPFNRTEVQIKLSGVVVGVEVLDMGTDTESNTLTVRNLTTGRQLHTLHGYSVLGWGSGLADYVLAPSGNIAWSAASAAGFGRRVKTLIVRAIGHTVTTLDSGPETRIRAWSLRLKGHTVEWIDGGKQRHAPLP